MCCITWTARRTRCGGQILRCWWKATWTRLRWRAQGSATSWRAAGRPWQNRRSNYWGRFTKRVIVNYDPDVAGQAATERSLVALLEQDFEVRVLSLPSVGDKKADPDLFIREKGADAYIKQVKEAPPYVDYLIRRASQMDLTTGEGKKRAVNFLLPYVQKIPNSILRSEWATRIAQQLRLDEPVLRAALSKAATERRSEVKVRPELVRQSALPAERRLIRMLAEADGFRRELAQRLQTSQTICGTGNGEDFYGADRSDSFWRAVSCG